MPNQIKYFIKLSARGFRSGLQTATRATRTFANKVKGLFRSVGKFILSPIGAIASLSVGFYKLFNAVSDGAKRFAELERQFANISTLMDGKLSQSVKNTIKDLAKLYGRESITLAKGYYDIVSAGITDQTKALDVLNSATKLAVAGYSNVKTTTSALLTVMEAYKDTNLSTTEAIDGMLGVIKFGRTTMDDFAGSVGRVLKLGSQAGVTFQEVTAMLSEMTKSGIETTEVVTQIRGVFASLVKVTPKQQKELQKLGIEWSVSAVKAKGFARVVQDLVKATKDLSDLETLGKIIPRVEGLSGFLNFAKTFPEALKRMEDNAGLVDEAFKKVSDTQEEMQRKIKESADQIWQDETFAKLQTGWANIKHITAGILKDIIDLGGNLITKVYPAVNVISNILSSIKGPLGVLISGAKSVWGKVSGYVTGKGYTPPASDIETGYSKRSHKQQAQTQAQVQAEQKVVTQYSKLAEVKKKILTLTTEAIQKMTEGIQKIREQTEKAVQRVRNLFFGGSAFEQMAQTRQILEGGEDRRFNFGRLREAGGKAFYTPEQELNFARAIEVLEKNGRDFDEFLRVFKAERGMNPKGQVNAFSVARGFVASPDFAGSIDDRRRQESAEMAERKIREEGRKKEELERQKFILGLNKGLDKIVKSANENLKASDQALNASKLFNEAIGKFEASNKKHEQNVSLLSGNYNKILEELRKERKIRIELAEGVSDFIQAKMEKSNQNNTLNRDAFADPNQQASTGP